MIKRLIKKIVCLILIFGICSLSNLPEGLQNGTLLNFNNKAYAANARNADIVFAIDTTGSMHDEISNVKNNISEFVNILNANNINVRLGLVEYKDIYEDGYWSTINRGWFSNASDFRKTLENIIIDGGGDGPESAVDALEEARRMAYQQYSKKFIILVTDADYKEGTRFDTSQKKILMVDEIEMLKNDNITVSVIASEWYKSVYTSLFTNTKGIFGNIQSGFSASLQSLTSMINTNELPSVSIISPAQNRIFGQLDTAFTPSISVSDADKDTLVCRYYIDSEVSPRETKTVSNTASTQLVNFTSINMALLSEGNHTLKFEVSDNWDNPVVKTIAFKVDRYPPSIGDVKLEAVEGGRSIIVTGSASDNISGLHSTPYRYSVGSTVYQSWSSNASCTISSLIPNTQYTVKFEARDAVGNISGVSKAIHTKAQAPQLSLGSPAETSIDVSVSDSNPAATQYQLMAGQSYASQDGTLTSQPVWITLTGKKLTVRGLAPGTQYGFKIKAKNNEGVETEFSQVKTGTTLAYPPSGVSFARGMEHIGLEWSPSSGALGYDVEADGALVYSGTAAAYTHTGLQPDTSHTYRVRVRNAGGTGGWSNSFRASTLPLPPGVPQNITTEEAKTEIRISWDPAERADAYHIKADGEIIDIGSNISYSHTGLLPGTPHTYSVRAVNEGGSGEWSEELSVETIPNPPDTPANIKAEPTRTNVTVTWLSCERAEGYEISADGDIRDAGAELSFLHDGLLANSSHTYRVRAWNRGGKSEWSDPVEITTWPEIPAVPSNIMATSGGDFIAITWYGIQWAESYDIELDGNGIENTAGMSYTHAGLTPGTKHTYRIRAKNISGEGQWSRPIEMSVLPQEDAGGAEPAVLINMVAVVTTNSVMVSWDAAARDAQYEIEVDGEAIDNGESTLYNHTGLPPQSFHTYRVRLKDGEGKGQWCAVLALSTLPSPPGAPSNITASSGNTYIELRWDGNEGASYDVEADGKIIDAGSLPEYIDEELSPGTTHTYRVRGKNAGGVTAWSAAITKSTTSPVYELECIRDVQLDFSLLASNVQDFSGLKFVVEYSPEDMEAVDLCRFTAAADIMPEGRIPGTSLGVKYTPGRIEFTVNESIAPGTAWSGEIATIVFRPKTDGKTSISFNMR
ncbi:von Willebrand factor type A domain-containing protein [Anaerobacterium chartisolvens]|uniref:von Willebrand factor type A domain-containing protein n=1 Tax=Anaerobacterium chartisolvens TaxID=1297424 RepID=A0A369BDV3_9FIRM|nr:VWA domain-containing protein [Anaerobacterium chartisolvens]RCX18766.1 von Willebrand factor type A domain-containing protein [Anaerobacterium chartisolvens]